MKTLVPAAIVAALSTHTVAQQNVPHIFAPSTPAKAAEVNENFDVLNTRLNELENLVQPGNERQLDLDVDCTENPAALNEAYLENWHTKNITFSIKGSCFGDIDTPRVEGDPEVQVHGQVIGISGADETAQIIANDITGNISLWASFGGGLYLNDLTIRSSGDIPVSFSRNGQGWVNNVTIIKEDGSPYAGLWVQEGGQVYVNNLTIQGFDVGIFGINGAVIRGVGDINISDVNNGIILQSSVFRGKGTINISANNNALQLDLASSWQGWDSTLSVQQGTVFANNGSNIVTNQINASNSNVHLYLSTLSGSNVSAKEMRINASQVSISDSTITENTIVEHGGVLEAYNSPMHNIDVWLGSTLVFGNSTIDSVNVNGNSSVHLGTTTISTLNINTGSVVDSYQVNFTGKIAAYTNATLFLNEASFSETTYIETADGAHVTLFEGTTIPSDRVSCHASTLTIDGVDVNSFENGCLNSDGYQEMINHFKSTRNN